MKPQIKEKQSYGTVTVDHFSPARADGWPEAINVTLSFEEALKLNLGLQQALLDINRLNRSTSAGTKEWSQPLYLHGRPNHRQPRSDPVTGRALRLPSRQDFWPSAIFWTVGARQAAQRRLQLSTATTSNGMSRTTGTSTKPTRSTSAHPGFWMRSVQFAGLHRILHRLAARREGVRAIELDRLVLKHGDYQTDRGEPSKTTLYHCRTTLLNLGAVIRRSPRLLVAIEDSRVKQLLDVVPVAQGERLPRAACDAFSSLALANADCHRNFFRLFVPQSPVRVDKFRQTANSVVWRSLRDEGPTKYELVAESSGTRIRLTAPIEIQATLYGVRDWACKQLGLLGEFHETGRGSVLFSLRHPDCIDAYAAARQAMLAVSPDSAEWTTVSVADLLRCVCESGGYSVAALHRGITTFVQEHPGYVSLIATIPNWATVTATTRKQADFHLETAFRDVAGRIISHLRFHHSIREQQNGKKSEPRRRAATG